MYIYIWKPTALDAPMSMCVYIYTYIDNPRSGIVKGTTFEEFVVQVGPLNTTLDFVLISSRDMVPHLRILLSLFFENNLQ